MGAYACVCGFWGVLAMVCSRLADYRTVLASMDLRYNPASLCNTQLAHVLHCPLSHPSVTTEFQESQQYVQCSTNTLSSRCQVFSWLQMSNAVEILVDALQSRFGKGDEEDL